MKLENFTSLSVSDLLLTRYFQSVQWILPNDAPHQYIRYLFRIPPLVIVWTYLTSFDSHAQPVCGVVVVGFVPITQMEKLRLRVTWHYLQLMSLEFGFRFPVAFVLWRLGKVKA